ncbi:MAG: replicative DNA helicase [Planctomycetota bacterium]
MSALPQPRFAKRDERKVELTKLFDKLPPSAPEAEAALLGSMILDWRVCADVLQLVKTGDDFAKPAHAAIYDALIELYNTTQSIDLVQLNQRLVDKAILDQVGGVDYLVELAESVPSATSAGYYAKIVRDKAVLRGLIEKAGTIIYDAYHADEPVGDLLDKAERAIFDLAEHQTNEDAATLAELLEQTYERLANDDGLSDAGLKSGFYELDEMTNGLHDGEMIIIAARPSMGKTALMLNIAEHMSVETKQPVAVFSLEMSKDQLAQRLLCSRSSVDSQKVRRNTLTPDDFERLAMACGELGECPMFIDDTPGLSILQLRAKARRLAARHSIQAVFVDYLQLMADPSTRENRQQEVSSISRGIKALARELSVPVICLSQLNRASESREGHRPRMSDLRESGSIEQDADVVMMLHREDYYHRGEDGYVDTNIAELIVAKQRNGPTGVVKLQFNGGTTRFNNLAAGAYGGV